MKYDARELTAVRNSFRCVLVRMGYIAAEPRLATFALGLTAEAPAATAVLSPTLQRLFEEQEQLALRQQQTAAICKLLANELAEAEQALEAEMAAATATKGKKGGKAPAEAPEPEADPLQQELSALQSVSSTWVAQQEAQAAESVSLTQRVQRTRTVEQAERLTSETLQRISAFRADWQTTQHVLNEQQQPKLPPPWQRGLTTPNTRLTSPPKTPRELMQRPLRSPRLPCSPRELLPLEMSRLSLYSPRSATMSMPCSPRATMATMPPPPHLSPRLGMCSARSTISTADTAVSCASHISARVGGGFRVHDGQSLELQGPLFRGPFPPGVPFVERLSKLSCRTCKGSPRGWELSQESRDSLVPSFSLLRLARPRRAHLKRTRPP